MIIFIAFVMAFTVAVTPESNFDNYDQDCVAKVTKQVTSNLNSLDLMQKRIAAVEDNCPKVK